VAMRPVLVTAAAITGAPMRHPRFVYLDDFDGTDDERFAAALAAAAATTPQATPQRDLPLADEYRHRFDCPDCGSRDIDVASHATPVPVVTWMRCRVCGWTLRPAPEASR
jgi:rubredoxin